MTANTQQPTKHHDEHLHLQQAAYSPNDSSESSKNHEADDIDESAKNLTEKKGRGKRKYNFQRASVACEQCRKAKTRCNYINNGSNCFRCENLSLKCSLNEIKLEPTLSTFQKSANLKTRDEVEGHRNLKKQRKAKFTAARTAAASPKTDSENIPVSASKIDLASLKPKYIDTSPVISSTSSQTNSSSQNTMLLIINDKIDRLSSTLKHLLDQKETLSSIRKSGPSGSVPNLQNPTFDINGNPYVNSLPSINHQSPPQIGDSIASPNIPPFLYPPISNFPLVGPSTPAGNFVPNNNVSQILRPAVTAPLARPYFRNINIMNPTHYPPVVANNSINAPIAAGFNISSITPDNNNNTNTNSLMAPSTSTTGHTSTSTNMVHENDEFFFLNAPYLDMSNIACNLGLPFTKEIGFDITRDVSLLSIQERYDLINRNLLDYETCYRLIEIGLFHYGKWITYVEADYKVWLDSIRITSPLLFCVLVLFGLRHHRPPNLDKNLELDILQSIHQLLSLSVYEVPQSKEFIQASILLAHFSPSLSYKHIYFDSWWVSSYGLIHFMTREMNMNLLVKSVKSPEKIHQYRLWNHLTVAHLLNCILSGRPCIIDEIRLDQCRDILVLSEANSFDAIVVAKISMLLTLYNSLQFPENLDTSLKELESTYSDWKHLTDNIALGSVVTGFYHFGRAMILRRYLLKNLYLKGQPKYTQRSREFFDNVLELIELGKAKEELLDGSDLFKQAFFLCVFMLLQFKQLDIFKEPNENIPIMEISNKYLEILSLAEKKSYCFNGYFKHYADLIVRLKNLVVPTLS
ncbi:hypothetical protein PMKS-001697 [Pichia membranifaciens]|uniref:Zn(2)-C6 fungal-type domain-containing protein n=1 Tax=Pichia membranifaciens TaxID=4926 RepID=A0A1Q2YF96_9ASCO|nr:hypothetical protein PMKS-001697 [Pichia membranifaciens]